ncbi:MAG: phosphomevalonate kinase [Streptococcaceae bacterium]|nr:phosphomevalonate kinase [Streptococcaceae bacterium]
MFRHFATVQEFHDWLFSEPVVTVKIPGKLFIAGEYAVTQPGGMAIVAAVDSDFSVSIKLGGSHSTLRTNIGLEDFSFRLADLRMADSVETPEQWHFALAAVRHFQAAVEDNLDIEVEIDIHSGLGFGETKKGYGSSAAVVCGIVKALDLFFDSKFSLREQFEIAADSHFEVQGSGSGGDIAAIIYGGLIVYRNRDLIEALDLPKSWKVYAISTGKSVKTGQKLTDLQLSTDFLADSNQIVEKLSRTQNFADFKEGLLENQEILRKNLPADYVTEQLAFALNAVNSVPQLAGKISGSGFGENIILFSSEVSQEDLESVSEKLQRHDMELEALKIAHKN